MQKINDFLVEDALALEYLFREAGLEAHSRAIRIALQDAQEDAIRECNYGTDTVFNGIQSAINIYKTVTSEMSDEKITNSDIIDMLDNNMEDINNITNLDFAPKFVKANNMPILQVLSSLIQHIKTQDPDMPIDDDTKSLLHQLQQVTGGK